MLTRQQLQAIYDSSKTHHTRVTCDANAADYTPAERDFLRAIQQYKTVMERPYPTWYEVLGVLKALGWKEPS